MKLGKYLIVTLTDFRRHYDFKLFYQNREEFVRDMHPDRIYYWDNKLIEAYQQICRWIKSSNNPDIRRIPETVISALKYYVGKKDIISETPTYKVDLTNEIIILPPDCDIELPAFDSNQVTDNIHIKLHKLIANKDSVGYSYVRIGDYESFKLEPEEIVYVTECNNLFIQFQPNKFSNEKLHAKLIDKDGSFGSILVIENLITKEFKSYDNILSFTIINGNEPLTINTDYMCNFDDFCFNMKIESLLERNFNIKPIMVVKSSNPISEELVAVLHDNGLMRTSDSKQTEKIIRCSLNDQ